jgi:hypothetical protein
MFRRCGLCLVLVLLLAPTVARAADDGGAPEQLLPAGTQIYVRWDGLEAHRAAFDKTALGKMLKGDMGKFLSSVYTQVEETLGSNLTVGELLQGVPPDQLKKMVADAAEAPKALTLLGDHGLLLGLEVGGNVGRPEAYATLIIPDAGSKPEPIFGTLRLAATLAKQQIKTEKIKDATVHSLSEGPVTAAWWVDGKHIVLSAGIGSAEDLVQRAHGDDKRLTDNPLFKKIKDFKEFETAVRGFVDLAALVKLGGSVTPDVDSILDELGLKQLKSATIYSGFEDEAERGVFELELTDGPRKGLLNLTSGKPFTLKDVPPLPRDVLTWTMQNFDAKLLYDEGRQVTEKILKIVNPELLPKVEEILKKLDTDLGVDVRKDLLGSLGDRVVTYASPAEGFLTLGTTVLFQVKDAQKLEGALQDAIKGAAKLAGLDVTIKKRTYHGVVTHEVHLRQQGFIYVPTYAIHDGWLAVAYYPQPVQGFILRSKKVVQAWKPGPQAQLGFSKLPQEFVSVYYSDPRPALDFVLSLAPLVGGVVESFLPDSRFDVGLIPNAHEVTRHLFPNVSVGTVKGNVIRLDTRASLALPF